MHYKTEICNVSLLLLFYNFSMPVEVKIPETREVTLEEPQQKVFDGLEFPLVLSPTSDSSLTTIDATLEWIKNNKDAIEEQLLKYGAILFRSFPLNSPADFDAFVKAFEYGPLLYVGGAAPRNIVVGDVYTTNESPPDKLIYFHHEMAQVPTFPKTLFFYCDVKPQSGGQTPLIVSHQIYKRMLAADKEFVEMLEEKGVKYTRVLPCDDDNTSAIGRGWKGTFQTQDKAEAERRCKEQGTEFEWLPDDCMKTVTATLPAIRTDTRTGKKTWFNSIIAAYRGWKDSRNSPEKAITFGDGTPMNPDTMDKLHEIVEELAIDFDWQEADVVMVDNRLVLHGRRTFVPPRRILAALCK